MENSGSNDHVLLFPFPANGHIKPFLCLAKLLCNAGLRVTFLSTDYNHRRLIHDDRRRLAAQFPNLHFESIPDGLPVDEPRDLLSPKFHISLISTAGKPFRELLISFNGGSSSDRPPVTCLITDVILRFPIDVAEELGVPVFCFCTFSARYLFLYFWIPKLIHDAHLPFPEGKKEEKVNGLGAPAEVEKLVRYKDLPGYWTMEGEVKYDQLDGFLQQTLSTSRSSILILNTFHELDDSFLTSLSKIYNKIYTIGPIHSLLNNNNNNPDNSALLAKELDDSSCLVWLDSKPSRSVVLVSFGSLVKITSSQLMEFWNGLLNSEASFLLVLRSNIVIEGDDDDDDDDEKHVMEEILNTKGNGRWLIVRWAPQEEVLSHEAIGGFLTHSGWNSTLESIAAGVPMISYPQIGDQSSNCTWVTKVWKIGLDMEDRCDRFTVETMVRSIMKQQHDEEMRKKIEELAKRANDGVRKNGTSYCNFESLVEDIKMIKLH